MSALPGHGPRSPPKGGEGVYRTETSFSLSAQVTADCVPPPNASTAKHHLAEIHSAKSWRDLLHSGGQQDCVKWWPNTGSQHFPFPGLARPGPHCGTRSAVDQYFQSDRGL